MPLRDKLCDLDCWITGLRRQQSDTRAGIGIVELYAFDEASGRDIVKLNPMAELDPRRRCGTTCGAPGFPTTRCTTGAIGSSAASPAPARRANGEERARRPLDRLQQGGVRHSHLHAQEAGLPNLPNHRPMLIYSSRMDYLSKLENQSIYILREAFNKFENLAMLWSIGKDSTVLLWLARKAFFGHVPFPLVHVDTTYKIPSMIEYRDRLVQEWNLQLIVGKNEPVLRERRHLSQRQGHARRVLRHAQERRAQAGAGQAPLHRRDRRRAPRRGTDPRQGALLQPARQEHGVERRGPAARAVGPVQDRFREGHAHPHPSAAALDGAERLGIHRAREHPGHPALLRQRQGRALPQPRLRALHLPRSSPTRTPSARSSRNCATPRPPNAPAAPRTRRARTPSRNSDAMDTCDDPCRPRSTPEPAAMAASANARHALPSN